MQKQWLNMFYHSNNKKCGDIVFYLLQQLYVHVVQQKIPL
jgi:hypothetical protein